MLTPAEAQAPLQEAHTHHVFMPLQREHVLARVCVPHLRAAESSQLIQAGPHPRGPGLAAPAGIVPVLTAALASMTACPASSTPANATQQARVRHPHLACTVVAARDETVPSLVKGTVGEGQDVRAQHLQRLAHLCH